MSIYELEIGWATTANERRYLHWELLACDEVRGVFLTASDDVLAVLFDGNRTSFQQWAQTLAAPERPHRRTTPPTNHQGALS